MCITHEKEVSVYVCMHTMCIYVHIGSVFYCSWMVVDHYLRLRQTRVSFMWMKVCSTWNKALPKKKTLYWPYEFDGPHPWVWFNCFALFQHLEKQLASLPRASSCLKGRKNPSSARAVNSMDFYKRNLDKSSLYLCKVQSENGIAVIHLYFSNAFCASSLNIYFKNPFGWKLADWLCTQK